LFDLQEVIAGFEYVKPNFGFGVTKGLLIGGLATIQKTAET
jgi:hypothetical protein